MLARSEISFKNCLAYLLIAIVCTMLAYYFIDRSLILFAHNHQLNRTRLWNWVEAIPHVFAWLVPAALLYFAIRFLFFSVRLTDWFVLAVTSSFIGAFIAKSAFKILLGRLAVPAFLHHADYGFRFFQGSSNASALPSGHMSLTTAVMMSVWFWFPRLRWLSVLVLALMAIALTCDLAHFLSDIISGFFLGTAIAYVFYHAFKKVSCYIRREPG